MTSGRDLRSSEQPSSGEILGYMDVIIPPPVWPSGGESSAMRERMEKSSGIPLSDEGPSEQLLVTVEETVTE